MRLPELARFERVWLWLSFQRYALLLAILAVAPLVIAASIAPGVWWSWMIAAPISLRLGALAIEVARRWDLKTRALRLALHRIRIGRFAPVQVRNLCGDPCFRVVAREAMRRAGYPAYLRRQRVRAFARELRIEAREYLVVDHTRGEVRRTSGDRITASLLASAAPPPTGATAT